jgi:hypothetical protein
MAVAAAVVQQQHTAAAAVIEGLDCALMLAEAVWQAPASARLPALFKGQQLSYGMTRVVRIREWPYEHIVPGIPKNEQPYNNGKQRGHKRFVTQEERQQKIDAAMAKMPQMIADYRVRWCRQWSQE